MVRTRNQAIRTGYARPLRVLFPVRRQLVRGYEGGSPVLSDVVRLETYVCMTFQAYLGPDGKVRLFHPELNMRRMERCVVRLALPVRFTSVPFLSSSLS